MLDVFNLVVFIAAICNILSFVLQAYSALSDAEEKAKPSAPTDGFDTGSESQDEEPNL